MERLVENKTVRQRPDEGYRRWFLNDYFDVIVWYESAGGELLGFQLCYNRTVDERAFTWQRNKRSSHFVSSGSDERGVPWIATAVLHGDAGSVPAAVLERLQREQGELDDDLLELIVAHARDYNEHRGDAADGETDDDASSRRRPAAHDETDSGAPDDDAGIDPR